MNKTDGIHLFTVGLLLTGAILSIFFVFAFPLIAIFSDYLTLGNAFDLTEYYFADWALYNNTDYGSLELQSNEANVYFQSCAEYK